MKKILLAYKPNIKTLHNELEKTTRKVVPIWIPNSDENIVKLHSHLTTQYILQFSTKNYIKPNNVITQSHYSKIPIMLSQISIEYINKVPHEAKQLAITASKLLIRKKEDDDESILWMLGQIRTISNLTRQESRKLFAPVSEWLDLAIAQSEVTIKKKKFKSTPYQEEMFDEDLTEASDTEDKSRKRNVTIK